MGLLARMFLHRHRRAAAEFALDMAARFDQEVHRDLRTMPDRLAEHLAFTLRDLHIDIDPDDQSGRPAIP